MRILRLITWLIALVALAAMGCVVALYFLITPAAVDKKIQNALASYGYVIKANELPQVRVLPNLSISLPPARILNEANQTVAFYRNAQFQISYFWLVFGKFYIDELKIDALAYENRSLPTFKEALIQLQTEKTAIFEDITIAKVVLSNAEVKLAHNGKTLNLQNLRAEVGEPSPQMHGVISLAGQAQIEPDHLLLDIESAFELDLNLAQGRVGLGNLVFRAQGTEAAQPISLSASSPLLKLTSDSLYASTAQLDVTRNALTTHVSVAELNVLPNHWQAPDLNARVVTKTSTGETKFDLRSPFNYDATTGALIADHLQGSLTLPGMTEPSSISGNLSANLMRESAQLEVFGRLHDAPMSFSGTVNGFAHPNIQGGLVLGRLKLQDLKLLSAFSSKKVSAEAAQETEVKAEKNVINEKQTADENVSAALSDKTADSSESSDQALVTSTENEPQTTQTFVAEPDTAVLAPEEDFQFLALFDFNGQVVIGELLAQNLRLTQVKSPVIIAEGQMKLPSIAASAYDGRFYGHLTLNQNGLWESTFKSSGVNLQQLLAEAGANAPASGHLNLQANLYGKGFDLNQLNGQLGFAVSDSLIQGLDLPKALKNIEQGRHYKTDEKHQTDVDQIKGLATLSQSVAQIEDLTAVLTGATVSGQAQVDLSTDLLRGELTGPSRRGLKVRLYLSDTWYQPKVSMSDEEIKRLNQLETLSKETQKAEEETSGWNRLKEFFNERF